jgi:lauroyl/myristoyl acyltransferase
MEAALYWLARGIVALIQALPLPTVARLGRFVGGVAYRCDARHRRVALDNLAACFGQEKAPGEIRALTRENFRRIGENLACAAKTATFTRDELRACLEVVGAEKLLARAQSGAVRSCIAAIGHFGNFELYARVDQFVPGLQCATTYRGLRQPSLNRLFQSLREKSGCLYFERRGEAAALKSALRETGWLLGLLADQHAGRGGLWLPFFGRDCSTSTAPAVFALRYQLPLHPAICYRVALGRWRIEVGEEIPTREHGQPRSIEAIALDMNRAFEAAVRRDPANWFWVHDRWKPPRERGEPRGARSERPQPAGALNTENGG